MYLTLSLTSTKILYSIQVAMSQIIPFSSFSQLAPNLIALYQMATILMPIGQFNNLPPLPTTYPLFDLIISQTTVTKHNLQLLILLIFSSLYPSAQTLPLPLCDYTLMSPLLHKEAFHALSQKLIAKDSAFFASKAKFEHLSYLVEADVVFDRKSVMNHSLDFSAFPEIRTIENSEMSFSQRQEYEKCHRSSSNIPKKLISDLRDGLIIEHIDSLFYLMLFFGAEIKNVRSIISFKIYDFFKSFSTKMADLRASTVSSVLKKTFKTYSNSLAVCFF